MTSFEKYADDLIRQAKTGVTSDLIHRVNAASQAYEDDVVNMTDRELYNHVFDGDYNSEDFASKELAKRGIKQFYPCPQCQGGGCPYCSGMGEIPTY